MTYSVQQVSLDGHGYLQHASSDTSQPTSLVLEPRYFPSRFLPPTIDPSCSVKVYNEVMRESFLKCYTAEIPSLLSHVIQDAIFQDESVYKSGLITTADPNTPLNRLQADTCRAITIAFTEVMTQVMAEKHPKDECPGVAFVDPSKWADLLDDTDPRQYIMGLGTAVGGYKGRRRDTLYAAMNGGPLSQQTKLEVYVKGKDGTLWSLRPDGRETRSGAGLTVREAGETVLFRDMPGRKLSDA